MDKGSEENQKLIHNLENVDQRELAKQNAFLRWLVLVFVVFLVFTAITLPYVGPNTDAPEAQVPQDYSNTPQEIRPVQFEYSDVVVPQRKTVTYIF